METINVRSVVCGVMSNEMLTLEKLLSGGGYVLEVRFVCIRNGNHVFRYCDSKYKKREIVFKSSELLLHLNNFFYNDNWYVLWVSASDEVVGVSGKWMEFMFVCDGGAIYTCDVIPDVVRCYKGVLVCEGEWERLCSLGFTIVKAVKRRKVQEMYSNCDYVFMGVFVGLELNGREGYRHTYLRFEVMGKVKVVYGNCISRTCPDLVVGEKYEVGVRVDRNVSGRDYIASLLVGDKLYEEYDMYQQRGGKIRCIDLGSDVEVKMYVGYNNTLSGDVNYCGV